MKLMKILFQDEKDSLLGKKLMKKIDKSKNSPIKNQLKNTNQIRTSLLKI